MLSLNDLSRQRQLRYQPDLSVQGSLIYRELLSKHAVKGMHACSSLAMWHGLAGLQQRRDFGRAFTASSSVLQAGENNEGSVEPGLQQLPAR